MRDSQFSWKFKSFKKDKTTCIFCSVLCAALFIIFLKLFSPSVQRFFLSQYHLKNDNFCLWALGHLLPSMYNYANEVWYSDAPFDETSPLGLAPYAHKWVNHYPLHVVTFGLYREGLFSTPKEYFFYLRSRYKKSEVTSVYHLVPQDNKLYLELIK